LPALHARDATQITIAVVRNVMVSTGVGLLMVRHRESTACCAAVARNLPERRPYQTVVCSPLYPRDHYFAPRTRREFQTAAAARSIRSSAPLDETAVAVAGAARARVRRRHHLRRVGRNLRVLRLPVARRDSRLPSE